MDEEALVALVVPVAMGNDADEVVPVVAAELPHEP